MILALTAIAGWCFGVAFLGWSRQHLSFSTPALRYLTESAFPVYLLHQSAIAIPGYFLIQLPLGVWTKFLILLCCLKQPHAVRLPLARSPVPPGAVAVRDEGERAARQPAVCCWGHRGNADRRGLGHVHDRASERGESCRIGRSVGSLVRGRRPGAGGDLAVRRRCVRAGRVAALIIRRKWLRAARSQQLRLLHLMPTDHVLEVGFVHGRTIELAADTLAHGFVAGVDLSEQMLRIASRRNRHHIAAGRVVLALSDATPLPFPDGAFDKVSCVHVLYFWPEPRRQLREIFRVLKPGGHFVLGFHARSDERAADFPASVYRFYEADEVESLLACCGFHAISSEVSPERTVFVSADR